MKTLLTLFLTLLGYLAMSQITWSIDTLKFIQPQTGESITLLRKVNDITQWITSEDGYTILLDKSGNYRYGVVVGGVLKPSPYLVRGINHRTKSEISYLRTIPRDINDFKLTYNEGGSVIWNDNVRYSIYDPDIEVVDKESPKEQRFPVIFILWENDSSLVDDIPVTYYDSALNLGIDNYTSFGGWLNTLSHGKFKVKLDFFPVVILPDFFETDANLIGLYTPVIILKALKKLDSIVDFSRYDNNGDGYIDNVFVFGFPPYQQSVGYPSTHMSSTASARLTSVWGPRYYYLPKDRIFDGLTFDTYNYFSFNSNYIPILREYVSIGTPLHEFSHTLNSPDFYDLGGEYHLSWATSSLDLMGTGNNMPTPGSILNGTAPAIPNPWIRIKWGWAKEITINKPDTITLGPRVSTDTVYRINTSKPGDYFLIENMYPIGLDTTFSRDFSTNCTEVRGLMIYHVDSTFIASNLYSKFFLDNRGPSFSINGGYHNGLYLLSSKAYKNPEPFVYNYNPPYPDTINYGSYYPFCNMVFPGITNTTSITDKTIPALKGWGSAWCKYVIDSIWYNSNGSMSFIVDSIPDKMDTVITTFPFTEKFNADTISNVNSWYLWSEEFVTTPPLHWEFRANSVNGKPTTPYEGNQMAYLGDRTSADNKTKLVSPAMDISGLTNPTLSFYHCQITWPIETDNLKVYYRISKTSPWVLLATYTNQILKWTKHTITLPNKSNTYYIAFEGNAKYGRGICIDDISVHTAP